MTLTKCLTMFLLCGVAEYMSDQIINGKWEISNKQFDDISAGALDYLISLDRIGEKE